MFRVKKKKKEISSTESIKTAKFYTCELWHRTGIYVVFNFANQTSIKKTTRIFKGIC